MIQNTNDSNDNTDVDFNKMLQWASITIHVFCESDNKSMNKVCWTWTDG